MQAEEYRRLYELEDRYWWFVSRRRLALWLFARRGGKGRVLDAACGTGAVTQALSKQSPTIGVDISDLAFRYIAEREPKQLSGLVKGDVQALPLGGDSFGTVVSLDTLEHVADDAAAASEMYRVLEPGGKLIANVPAFRWLFGPHDVALMHHRRYTTRELRTLLEEAGFRVEMLSYSVFLLFPVVLLVRLLERRRGGERISLPEVPDWLNGLLIWLMDLETRLMGWFPLPWGSSVVAVAAKPERTETGSP